MASYECVLLRRTRRAPKVSDDLDSTWKQLKLSSPDYSLTDPQFSVKLSKKLAAEVVICVLQNNASLFFYSHCDQGEVKRQILYLGDSIESMGGRESWESSLDVTPDDPEPPLPSMITIAALETFLAIPSRERIRYSKLKLKKVIPPNLLSGFSYSSIGGPRWLLWSLGVLITAIFGLITLGLFF